MGRIIIFIIIILLSSKLSAQRDTLKLSNQIPIKKGYILVEKGLASSRYINPTPGVIISNSKFDSDSVFSVSRGEVVATRKDTIYYTCVVRFNEFFYTYSNLKYCNLKKGAKLNRGDFIGRMDVEDDFSKALQFIATKKGKYLNLKEHISLLK